MQDEEQRAATFFRGFPIKQTSGGPGRGRYVVSARPIKRGEVVLQALPYALAPKLPARTCARCFRYHPAQYRPSSSVRRHRPESGQDDRRAESGKTRVAEDEVEQEGEGEEEDDPDAASVAVMAPSLQPCSGGCGVAFYCSVEEEADDWDAGHALECAVWRRIREVGASMELTESEQAEMRLAFRIVARYHASLARQDGNGDTDADRTKAKDREDAKNEAKGELVEPTFDDVLRLCSNRERRPLEEITFWRKVVQRMIAPFLSGDDTPGGGLSWTKHDFVELIGKDLCNGFGLRGAHGECYAYGVYPAASYFNHSCYPNICRLDQDADSSSHTQEGRQRFVALMDIPAGHEMTLSYIDASKPTEHRRLALSTIYFFHCTCVRCENSSSGRRGQTRKRNSGRRAAGGPFKDDYVQRFVCRSCTKHNGRGVLYPFSPSHDRCNLCRKLVARKTSITTIQAV